MSSRKSYTVDVRDAGAWAINDEDTTALTIYMSHDRAKLLRALLSQGTFASDGEAAGVFRKIKNSLAHVQDWKNDVDAQGAKITPKPVIPTAPGTTFKARVERGHDIYEGDVFVAKGDINGTVYVTPRSVGGVLSHGKDQVTRVF
jgi:hypothetical protein